VTRFSFLRDCRRLAGKMQGQNTQVLLRPVVASLLDWVSRQLWKTPVLVEPYAVARYRLRRFKYGPVFQVPTL
jgi:hypothetical protein